MIFRSIGAPRWTKLFFATVLLFTLMIGGINYWVDYYGLFRDLPDKNMVFFGNERTSKFLYSYRYIPQKYDGLLIGSSFSNNWDTSFIHSARVYNASLDGGNITEGKLIFDNVQNHGKIRLLVIGIYPYLTSSQGRQSGYMDPREYWGALGSLQLFREYATRFLVKIGMRKNHFGANGRYTFELPESYRQNFYANPKVRRGEETFRVSDAAVKEFEDLLISARANGTKIVGIIPPIYAAFFDEKRPQYEAYIKRMSTFFLPSEKIVNFNLAPYQKYVNDPKTFQDGIHLTTKAAGIFSRDLAAIIDAH